MSLAEARTFECPYCMAINELELDWINDLGTRQVVDCQICCQPIELEILQIGDDAQLIARRDDE